ncbi:MAG: glycosyltransferase family 4 protein [Acidimicrobiales bacterium]|nr:glycosyltransferase family 4 protein [Acidimicrobiales bacterium]
MATDQRRPARGDRRRVLHVITSDQRRGAETFAVDLAAALAARDVASEVVALAPAASGSRLGVPVLGDAALAPVTLRALRRLAAGARVVVAHGSRTLPACALGLAGRRTPVVYRSIGDPAAWAGGGLRRARTRLLLRRTAAVTVLWPGAGDAVHALYAVPPDRIHVIPNAVPAARCPVPDAGARRDARARLGLPGDAPVVAAIGALAAEKRVGAAIGAVAALEGVHLLVAGDGPERAPLEQRAAAVAPGRVHFAGSLPGPTDALAAADVVVLTSRTEGMPGVLVEAGLSGVAAVATDVGGVATVVRDGETGVLVPPGDAAALTGGLRRALADRERLGAAARRHCMAHFEMGPVADRWATLVDNLAPQG